MAFAAETLTGHGKGGRQGNGFDEGRIMGALLTRYYKGPFKGTITRVI